MAPLQCAECTGWPLGHAATSEARPALSPPSAEKCELSNYGIERMIVHLCLRDFLGCILDSGLGIRHHSCNAIVEKQANFHDQHREDG